MPLKKIHMIHYVMSKDYIKGYCGAYVKKEQGVPAWSDEVTCEHCSDVWEKTRKLLK